MWASLRSLPTPCPPFQVWSREPMKSSESMDGYINHENSIRSFLQIIHELIRERSTLPIYYFLIRAVRNILFSQTFQYGHREKSRSTLLCHGRQSLRGRTSCLHRRPNLWTRGIPPILGGLFISCRYTRPSYWWSSHRHNLSSMENSVAGLGWSLSGERNIDNGDNGGAGADLLALRERYGDFVFFFHHSCYKLIQHYSSHCFPGNQWVQRRNKSILQFLYRQYSRCWQGTGTNRDP